MIAARLLQLRDRERALGMYSDAIAATLSLEELRKLEGVSAGKSAYPTEGGRGATYGMLFGLWFALDLCVLKIFDK